MPALRQPPPRPSSSGPSAGDVLVGAGLFAAGVAALVGIVSALDGGRRPKGSSYDADVGRYRDKKGRFSKD